MNHRDYATHGALLAIWDDPFVAAQYFDRAYQLVQQDAGIATPREWFRIKGEYSVAYRECMDCHRRSRPVIRDRLCIYEIVRNDQKAEDERSAKA